MMRTILMQTLIMLALAGSYVFVGDIDQPLMRYAHQRSVWRATMNCRKVNVIIPSLLMARRLSA